MAVRKKQEQEVSRVGKGKAYYKWLANHPHGGKARRNLPIKLFTDEQKYSDKHEVLVHGYFLYECESCGAVYQMYLEKGLEDKIQDKQYPEKHKPVPFIIGCKVCTQGLASHVLWGIGDTDKYEVLPEGASYFENISAEECGKPVINQYYTDRDHWRRSSIWRIPYVR